MARCLQQHKYAARPQERNTGRPTGEPDGGAAAQPVEKEPAVERGERIDPGKTIGRGGNETGARPRRQ